MTRWAKLMPLVAGLSIACAAPSKKPTLQPFEVSVPQEEVEDAQEFPEVTFADTKKPPKDVKHEETEEIDEDVESKDTKPIKDIKHETEEDEDVIEDGEPYDSDVDIQSDGNTPDDLGTPDLQADLEVDKDVVMADDGHDINSDNIDVFVMSDIGHDEEKTEDGNTSCTPTKSVTMWQGTLWVGDETNIIDDCKWITLESITKNGQMLSYNFSFSEDGQVFYTYPLLVMELGNTVANTYIKGDKYKFTTIGISNTALTFRFEKVD
jgi:hypothetical protein